MCLKGEGYTHHSLKVGPLLDIKSAPSGTDWPKYFMCPLSLIPVNSLHGLRYVVLKSCTVGLHIQETKKTEKVCVMECVGPVWSKMPGPISAPAYIDNTHCYYTTCEISSANMGYWTCGRRSRRTAAFEQLK